jgi:predicted TPR repeat methyltransferase
MQTDNEPTQQYQEQVPLEKALATAIWMHQSRQLDDAEAIYRFILEQVPRMPEALHFLGLLTHQKGDSQGGVVLIEQALAEAPNYADAHNNLGNIFKVLGQHEQAVKSYRQTLTLNPENISAHNNLGLVLKDIGQFDEAATAILKAIALMPDNAEFYCNLGNVYSKQCNFSEAAKAYQKTLSLRAYDPFDYENLCRILYLKGNVDEAIDLVNQWLQHDPENALALHRLAAYTGDPLTRASDAYVTQTFDGFADSFDHVLKGLEYKAPFLVLDAIETIYGTPSASLNLLDAGCGTGLCGALLKPYAAKLTGVDLSQKMLDKAEQRGCYQELVQSELTAFIGLYQSEFDCIVSADTLVYFGDLQAVSRAVASALKDGGYFIFTLERCEDAIENSFKINPHGRFSHTEVYIRNVLETSGLTVIKIEPAVLRYEIGEQVGGYLVIAQSKV